MNELMQQKDTFTSTERGGGAELTPNCSGKITVANARQDFAASSFKKLKYFIHGSLAAAEN